MSLFIERIFSCIVNMLFIVINLARIIMLFVLINLHTKSLSLNLFRFWLLRLWICKKLPYKRRCVLSKRFISYAQLNIYLRTTSRTSIIISGWMHCYYHQIHCHGLWTFASLNIRLYVDTLIIIISMFSCICLKSTYKLKIH